MPTQNPNVITLFSSESSEKYINDIFTVLALPRDATYHFSYNKDYVKNEICSIFDSLENHCNIKALVAFRSANIEEENKRFIVPIRWVEITKVETNYSNFYTVMFKVLGYPTFTQIFSEQCYEFSNINKIAKSILDSTTNNFAVISNGLNQMVDSYKDNAINDNDNWLKIIKILTCIQHYEDYHFLKCSTFFSTNDKYNPHRNNNTILEEGRLAYLKIEYYQKKYNTENNSSLEVVYDKTIISQISGLGTKMGSSYNFLKLGFQPKNTMNETFSEIIIYTSESNKLSTKISLPIIIIKPKTSLFIKSLVMSFGAFLVGLPALLPDILDVNWKILIAMSGACVMGLNYFINLKGK